MRASRMFCTAAAVLSILAARPSSAHHAFAAEFDINRPIELDGVGAIPRLLDMGQCNNAYSAIQVAVALSQAFGCILRHLRFSFHETASVAPSYNPLNRKMVSRRACSRFDVPENQHFSHGRKRLG